MHKCAWKEMSTYIYSVPTHTLVNTPPFHRLCAVCLKWQCLCVILRQMGREYQSIKRSQGTTEGWNNGWWKWQKTLRCSLLYGLCRGGDFAKQIEIYRRQISRSLKRSLFNRLCFRTLPFNSFHSKSCEIENVTAICKVWLAFFKFMN